VRRWTPSNWASWKPFGLGEQHPNNYLEIAKAVGENRDRLGYAWRILRHGVCDGCSLGTAGMRDWTLDGVHLCNIRLRLLRLNTAGPFPDGTLDDVEALRTASAGELRELGRIPYPLVRRKGERGFRRVGWDEALDLVAAAVSESSPDRLGVYLTSRGMANENYYAAQKAVRALGSNSVDNAARVCHSPSTFGLKGALGVAATTCSYRDWLSSDLIVFIGCNVANNQPVTMKYLHYAKKNGAKVAVVNTYREPGMERYWIPSTAESALFGTKIADRFDLVNAGGDVAFLNGALKHMVEQDWLDSSFVEEHTAGFDALSAELAGQSWEELERVSGVPSAQMLEFARLLHEAGRAVFVWAMGITQNEFGEAGVRAIVNLGLTKGFVGREGCGLMPIRGHSGVQGGAEMGCYSTSFPGGLPVTEENAARLTELWGFEVPAAKGLTAPEMIDAAWRGDLGVLVSVGGNFLEVLPDPGYVREALERTPLRVHVDIVLSPQMLLEAGETVVILPAATRYEIPGGVTETTTERRVIFSPEIPGPRVGEARPEWRIFVDLAQRVRPDLAGRIGFTGTGAIREDIARTIPAYERIRELHDEGDQFQYGGERLCEGWVFPTADGKAHFTPVPLPAAEARDGRFVVTTRRGKQFNSIVHEQTDAITGATRDSVLMSEADARALGLADGERVVLRSEGGAFSGRVRLAPVKPGSLQVHWPEGNVLVPRGRRSAESGIPDYNALVSVERDG
jgi:molybdopterin-dependent oxidoreductase alpha subunit